MRKFIALALIAATLLEPIAAHAAAALPRRAGATGGGDDDLLRRVERDLYRLTRDLASNLKQIEKQRKPFPASAPAIPSQPGQP
jgi:hypothetical protein